MAQRQMPKFVRDRQGAPCAAMSRIDQHQVLSIAHLE
jgi:hypothetical protein